MIGTIKRKKIFEALVLIIFFAFECGYADAATRYVPSPYSTIQAAINACNNGDVVIVADGTYTGPGNRDIDFLGKAITVRSQNDPESTIIDCQKAGRGFIFKNGEATSSVLSGLTIINGHYDGSYPRDWGGGGINCENSSPTIENCVLENCSSVSVGGGIGLMNASPSLSNCNFINNKAGADYAGGGIFNSSGSPMLIKCIFKGNSVTGTGTGGGMNNQKYGGACNPTLIQCTFIENSAPKAGAVYNSSHVGITLYNCMFIDNWAWGYGGGGIYNWGCGPVLNNCLFSGNSAEHGGAILNGNVCSPTLTNCTFTRNSANYGSTVGCFSGGPSPSNVQITNCILWDGEDEIWNSDGSTITITYSDVQGGWPGEGNIDADPLFQNSAAGDYHLTDGSPCIDAGDPTGDYTGQTDIDGEPRVMNGRVDIGADECSEPPCPPLPPHEPWSFVHMTDTHLGDVPKATDSLCAVRYYIKRMSPKPAFVLVTGDISNVGCTIFASGCFFTNYSEYTNIMDGFGIPYYTIPGNHDRKWGRIATHPCINGLSCYASKIEPKHDGTPLPSGGVGNYWFKPEDKGFLFIGLDTGPDNTNAKDYLTDPQMDDLEELGNNNKCMPKIVFMHHPAAGGGNNMIDKNRKDFLDWCDKYDVKVVITGHTHQNVVCDRNGNSLDTGEVGYIQTPSRTLFSGGAGRSFRIFNVNGGIVTIDDPIWTQEILNGCMVIQPLSPVELHVYDSQSRHVEIDPSGIVEGEIPGSYSFPKRSLETEDGSEIYPEKIIIFEPTDDYLYELIGTEEGIYGLDITYVSGGVETTFKATDIPTTQGARHVYAVDWSTLSTGGEGVILNIDNNGDGSFEQMIIANNELTSDEFALQTETVIDFNPDTLNLKSKGKFVTVYIELPDDFDVSEIDISSLRLNELVPALPKPIAIGDFDSDGIGDLMVKFDRQELITTLGPGGEQMVDLSGQLSDGRRIAGSDFIRVIHESQGKKN